MSRFTDGAAVLTRQALEKRAAAAAAPASSSAFGSTVMAIAIAAGAYVGMDALFQAWRARRGPLIRIHDPIRPKLVNMHGRPFATVRRTPGEFVREEIHAVHVKGKRGARAVKQAIAVGLSRARAAGLRVAKRKGRS